MNSRTNLCCTSRRKRNFTEAGRPTCDEKSAQASCTKRRNWRMNRGHEHGSSSDQGPGIARKNQGTSHDAEKQLTGPSRARRDGSSLLDLNNKTGKLQSTFGMALGQSRDHFVPSLRKVGVKLLTHSRQCSRPPSPEGHEIRGIANTHGTCERPY